MNTSSLFDESRYIKKGGAKSERDIIVGDLFSFFESKEIKLIRKGKMTMRYFATLLSPIATPDLYFLLSQMKQSKNPAALFWATVRPK